MLLQHRCSVNAKPFFRPRRGYFPNPFHGILEPFSVFCGGYRACVTAIAPDTAFTRFALSASADECWRNQHSMRTTHSLLGAGVVFLAIFTTSFTTYAADDGRSKLIGTWQGVVVDGDLQKQGTARFRIKELVIT